MEVVGQAATAGEDGAQPSRLTLSSVRPNPFASRAAVDVDVDAAQRVAVEVYNLLGQRVATLFDGTLQPGGRTLTLDGAGLAPGVYVVRMTGDDFVQSRKAVLTR